MRELDVLLTRFLREEYPQAPERARRAFVALLELPDPVLADYLLGGGPAGVLPADRELAVLAARVARRTADPNW